jgi:phage-related protein
MSDGGDPGLDPGGIDLSGVLAGIEQAIINALEWLWQELVALYEWILGELEAIIQWLVSLVQALVTAIKNIWEWIYNFIILPLEDIIHNLFVWLKNFLAPVLRILNRIRTWYLTYIYPWVKLAQQIISELRIALQLLKLLGVKWAAQLDADLQTLSSWITMFSQDVIKSINTMSSLLEAIVDPALILRSNFFAATLFSNIGAVKRTVAYGNNTPLTPNQSAQQQADVALLNPATPPASIGAGGVVTTAPDYATMQANFGQFAGVYAQPPPHP